MESIISFFIRRPLLVNLCMVFALVAGVLGLQNLNYNVYPDLDVGAATITTHRPGSSSQDIELSVTIPLEEEILKVDGIDKLFSNSMEGMSSITVIMSPDNSRTQNDSIEIDLQKAIDRANARLPDDIPEKPTLVRHHSDRIPVVELLISGDVPEETLRTTARHVANALREVDGVAGVKKEGYRRKEVHIQLDANQMHQLGIGFNEITDAIKRRNLRDSGGSIESFVSEKDILTVGQFQHPKEVEEVIIRAVNPGNYVRVRDIAKVVTDYEEWSVQSSTDGETGISLYPRTQAGADGLRVAERIRAFSEDIATTLPPGVKISLLNDMSRFTRDMLGVLTANAFAGIVLVFLVLLAFFPLRFASWVTIGIPVAVLMVFGVMPLFDLSVNQLSLGGLILMLGLLVDDAVVTSESIFRQSELGDDPINAAIRGTTSVAPPVLTSAATTILAFAPAAFLGGIEGKFMWMAPVMAMLALAASLIECKLMLPAHIRHSLEKHHDKQLSRSWFNGIEQRYRKAMQYILPRRYRMLVLFSLVFGSIIFFGVKIVKINLYPEYEVDAFYIQAELPMGYSFENTREKLKLIESIVRETVPSEDLLNITQTVGHHDYDPKEVTAGRHSSWGLVSVYTKPIDQRKSNTLELISSLRLQLKGFDDFTRITVSPQRETPVVGRSVELEVIGNDESRYDLAEIIQKWLQQHPGTSEVWSSYSPGKDVINLHLNHEALADHGIVVADITRAVRAAFDGYLIDELQTVDERIRYRLKFDKPDNGNMSVLRSLVILNKEGLPVPLRSLVEYEVKTGESAIRHYFGDRTTTVYAEINRDVTSTLEINTEIKQFIEDNKLQQEYSNLRLNFGGEYSQQNEAVGNVGGAFLMCICGIFFILVLLFNSLSQPLLVLSIIPLGFAGVLVAFIGHDMDLSMPALTGTIGLAGVLVNDSLVMIDRLNVLKREKGDDVAFLSTQEIVTGSCLRLRPIFITTVTTVAGLFPAAYGLAGENPFVTPMIMAMLWGVAFGSLITLFYLPCLYAMEQDLRQWINSFQRKTAQ